MLVHRSRNRNRNRHPDPDRDPDRKDTISIIDVQPRWGCGLCRIVPVGVSPRLFTFRPSGYYFSVTLTTTDYDYDYGLRLRLRITLTMTTRIMVTVSRSPSRTFCIVC